MKTIKKIIPVIGMTAIGTIPFATTSCSNVWVDLYTKRYLPNFEQAPKQEVTAKEALKIYKDRFLSKQGDMPSDFYWGSSIYCRQVLAKSEQVPTDVLTYLNHIYDVKMVDGERGPIVSYKLKAQIQLKHMTATGSYSINSYDLYWEINNLEFWIIWYKTLKDTDNKDYQMWSLCPFKFDTTRGAWWREMEGDEQIKFDFKTVYKGFGKNGGQNYAWESSEAAIIDNAHKYAPELNEVYTSVMLFDTYYLSSLSPKVTILEPRVVAIETAKSGVYENTINVTFGSQTAKQCADEKCDIKLYGKPIISRATEDSKLEVEKIEFGDLKITSDVDVPLKTTITTNGATSYGDTIYYTIEVTHPKCAKSSEWKEYFTIRTPIYKW